jgi:hypothetical protein
MPELAAQIDRCLAELARHAQAALGEWVAAMSELTAQIDRCLAELSRREQAALGEWVAGDV